MREYIHLHNHTHYSLLDAITTPQDLVDAAIKDGQKAVALTDHGVLFGALEFYKYSVNKGIKPIIGMEAYMASGSRFEKISGKIENRSMRNYFHLLLLAKDNFGYKNLMKLTTLGHTEGFYYKPRIDKELLEKYREGLIACSACITGIINAYILNDKYDDAFKTAEYYRDLFGEDFYIEIQNHGLSDDAVILEKAPKIAKELGINIVATNDVHYLSHEHAVAHNVYLNIRDVTANTSGQVDIYKLRYRTPEMYFKTQKQMNELFRNFPDALDNTQEIADKCNLKFESKIFMPEFPIPKNTSAKNLEDLLEELTYNGLKERFSDISKGIRERVDYELNVINRMGFAGYFLIVSDFVKAAKELGVRVGPGRGSAAGSLVAYALGITTINPLQYDLLFERFLNPDRISLPDIDIDFSDDKRDLVLNYVKKKYGENSIAMIITFGKLSTKAVITDVGRVIGVPLKTVREINSKIPVVRGKVTPLREALELPDLKWIKKSEDPKIKELVNYCLILEDKNRNASTHAAGVVIAPGDITEYVPLYQQPKTKEKGLEVSTQYSFKELEYAGLLKMDFLGLRTLSIIDKTIELIEKNHNVKIDIDSIDFEDNKVYDLISQGNTIGVFQFESSGMQEYLRRLKPRNLEELTAMNALYRPGPMDNIPEFIERKHGKKKIEYLLPIMKNTLEKTYGIIVYQEQVMQLVRDIAGFSLGQADILRRAMGKKDKKEMAKIKPLFIEGAKKNGYDEKVANEVFDLIYKFADYGFNKSHSLAYSYLAFQTAWLKTYYPAEFLAANMTAEFHDQTKVVTFIEESKKFGIEVMPPDINHSLDVFNAISNTIFFSLAAIRNVGLQAVKKIIQARASGHFKSIFDFVSRVESRLINKRTLEALVCAGAFDSVHGGKRAALFDTVETALEYAKKIHDRKSDNSEDLFAGNVPEKLFEPSLKDVPEWTELERLEKEKEYLNFYVSGHPLYKFKPYIQAFSLLPLDDTESKYIGSITRVCGIITNVRTRLDKKNNTIGFITIEDFKGKAEGILWSDTYNKFSQHLKVDKVILCEGKAELDDNNIKIIIDKIMPIEDSITQYAKGYQIWVDLNNYDLEKLAIMHKRFCNNLNSSTKIKFNIKSNRTCYISDNVNIKLNQETLEKLVELFGENNVGFITE